MGLDHALASCGHQNFFQKKSFPDLTEIFTVDTFSNGTYSVKVSAKSHENLEKFLCKFEFFKKNFLIFLINYPYENMPFKISAR